MYYSIPSVLPCCIPILILELLNRGARAIGARGGSTPVAITRDVTARARVKVPLLRLPKARLLPTQLDLSLGSDLHPRHLPYIRHLPSCLLTHRF